MAITLITPAAQWIAGATVQFKFDCYAYEQNRYFNIDPYFGLWPYTSQWLRSIIFGLARFQNNAYTQNETRILWTHDQITDFINSDGHTWAATPGIYNIAGFGPDNMLDTDAYATFVSASPTADALNALATFTNVIESLPTFLLYEVVYSITEDKTRIVYRPDGAVHDIQTWQEIYSGSRWLPLETQGSLSSVSAYLAQLAAVPNVRVVTGIDYYLNPYTFKQTTTTAITAEMTGSTRQSVTNKRVRTKELASTEVTVTLVLKQDLPHGGLYLFAPVLLADTDPSGGTPSAAAAIGSNFSYYEDNDDDYLSQWETAHLLSYDALLIDPYGETREEYIGPGLHIIEHDTPADLSVDDVLIGNNVVKAKIAPEYNRTYRYQWNSETERKVIIKSGKRMLAMRNVLSGIGV